MTSIQFEDDNGVMWTAKIKLGIGKAIYGANSFDPTKPHLLVFASDDKSISDKTVPTKKSSISDYSIEELKTLLKKSQQSKS